jgi:hypothetical protein
MLERSDAVRQGMLLVCTNVDPAHEDDFNRWYDREHVNERIAIPGFVSGARYQAIRGSRRYLGLYRTTSLAVFETAAYQQALRRPTAWSVTNLARMQNPMRRVCSIEMETGAGTGAWLALLSMASLWRDCSCQMRRCPRRCRRKIPANDAWILFSSSRLQAKRRSRMQVVMRPVTSAPARMTFPCSN